MLAPYHPWEGWGEIWFFFAVTPPGSREAKPCVVNELLASIRGLIDLAFLTILLKVSFNSVQ